MYTFKEEYVGFLVVFLKKSCSVLLLKLLLYFQFGARVKYNLIYGYEVNGFSLKCQISLERRDTYIIYTLRHCQKQWL